MDNYLILKDMLERNRSVRRFDQSRRVPAEVLEGLVGLARLCASGRNLQPLRYRVVVDGDECDRVYGLLKWAGYYKDWDGPAEGERPVAYLVQCIDTRIAGDCLCDDGLQLEAVTLGATALGLSCCIIKSFAVSGLSLCLGLPQECVPRYVVALGHAGEEVRIVDVGPDGDIRYYRDDDVQCVPKRSLEDMLIK